ncbi:MAG: isoprenylcysteine carboxylmethyltransferase family protein [Pseudomonadales bacterium]|nr:isoprenylcysteine carboxylmethyltransferase family protein [Pseudomonadales bacterium]
MQAFENKIPPPIVAALFAAAMWGLSLTVATFDMNLVARGIAIAVAMGTGAFFCLAGVLSFKKAATTVNPLKPETAPSLVSTGIYKITRNPMYLGFTLFLIAWAIYLSSLWVFLGVVGFILYINRFQIVPEERALVEIFGSEFTRYQSQVRRWL